MRWHGILYETTFFVVNMPSAIGKFDLSYFNIHYLYLFYTSCSWSWLIHFQNLFTSFYIFYYYYYNKYCFEENCAAFVRMVAHRRQLPILYMCKARVFCYVDDVAIWKCMAHRTIYLSAIYIFICMYSHSGWICFQWCWWWWWWWNCLLTYSTHMPIVYLSVCVCCSGVRCIIHQANTNRVNIK